VAGFGRCMPLKDQVQASQAQCGAAIPTRTGPGDLILHPTGLPEMESDMSDFLTETEACAYLETLGVPIAARTLTNKRWAGTGPAFVKALRKVRYRRVDLDAWAAEQVSSPRRSTSAIAA
jgi:hypothetical protein